MSRPRLHRLIVNVLTDGSGDFEVVTGYSHGSIVGIAYDPLPTPTVNQKATVLVDATSGTFTLTYDGEATDAIALNETAANVLVALRANDNIGPADCTCVRTGSVNAYTYTIEFTGTLAGTYAVFTGEDIDLAGGGDAITVTRTQGGPLATGWDLVVSADVFGIGSTDLIDASNLGTSSFEAAIVQDAVESDLLTAASGQALVRFIGPLTVTVAQGGTIAEGQIVLLINQ